jgi:hypothetical protein
MTKHYRVVLEAGDHAVVRSEATVALEPLNAGARERGAEEWVFSCSLRDTSPALVTGHVHLDPCHTALSKGASICNGLSRSQQSELERLTMGLYVQKIPDAVASTAVARAVERARAGSHEAASPSGMGKTVHMPCQTSAPKIRGMPSRLSSTATRCSSLLMATPWPLYSAPIEPLRRKSSVAFQPPPVPGLKSEPAGREKTPSCPAFSASVILASSGSTRGSSAVRSLLLTEAAAVPVPASSSSSSSSGSGSRGAARAVAMLGVAARVWWPLLHADRTAASLGTASRPHGGSQGQ